MDAAAPPPNDSLRERLPAYTPPDAERHRREGPDPRPLVRVELSKN
jgi:hypothetical protein